MKKVRLILVITLLSFGSAMICKAQTQQWKDNSSVTKKDFAIALSSPLKNGGYNLSCFGGNDGSINMALSATEAEQFTFEWLGPNGYTSREQNPTGLYGGTYQLVLTEGSAIRTYLINLSQPAPINYSVSKTNVSCCGKSTGSITVTNVSGGISPYMYEIPNYDNEPHGSNIFSELPIGTYFVWVRDANHCLSEIHVNRHKVVITEPDKITIDSVSITNASSPYDNGDDIQEAMDSDESPVSEYLADVYDFKIFPNPASDHATITFSSDNEEKYTIRLIDLLGRIVFTTEKDAVIGDNQYQVDISVITKGVYTVVLQKGGIVTQNKIVIQ